MSHIESLRVWWTHRQAHNQMLRQLVGPALSPNDSIAFAAHMTDCAQCRAHYDRLQATITQSLGLLPSASTPWQRESVFERAMAEAEHLETVHFEKAETLGAATEGTGTGPEPSDWIAEPPWRWAFVAAASAATVVALWVASPLAPPTDSGDSPTSAVRGGVDSLPDAALGFSGVDQQGGEYEVVQSSGICLNDALRIYARVRNPSYRFVAVFAVQEDSSEPTWYFPSQEEQVSYEVPDTERPWPFPEEIPMAPNHHAGTLLVVAVFSSATMTVEQLQGDWLVRAGMAPEQDSIAIAQSLLEEWSALNYVVQGTEVQILDSCTGGRP